MAYDGTIKIDTSINSSGVTSGVKSIVNSIGKIAGALGIVKVASGVFNMLKSSINSAFSRSDTMEQFNRTMSTITGNTDAAGQALEELKGITKGTAYGLDIAAKATQDFVTRGMKIGDATKTVGIWADAVSFYGKGTNEELQSVTDALAKMSTKGKVEMDQLNRLFDVGIDAVGMYAKATGRSSAEVQDDLSKGKISSEEFINTVSQAMTEGTNGVQKVAGAAKQAGASWRGTMDNMQAACTRGMLAILDAIDNGLKSINLPTMRQMIADFGSTMESTLNNIGGKISSIIKEFVPAIMQAFSGGGIKTAIETFGNIFSNLGKVISSVAKVVLPVLSKALDTIGKNIKIILPITLSLVAAFKAFTVVQKVQAWMKSLSTVINKAVKATTTQVVATNAQTAAAAKQAAAEGTATSAITLKQIAIGLLTGKLTLATIKQWEWNAALSANPIGLVVAAVAAMAAIIGVLCLSLGNGNQATQAFNDGFASMANAAQEYQAGLSDAKSHLSDFNDELFASADQQQALSDNMQTVQQGITNICKTASDERRDYTQEEIQQLDNYFDRLNELYQQQLAIEQVRSKAILQQAETEAQTFSGSLEEYKAKSQEWIKTAQEQSDTIIAKAKEQSIQEIALLNQRYGDQANMQNEAYKKEYDAIIARRDSECNAAKETVAKVTEIFAKGYSERSGQTELYSKQVTKDNLSLEKAMQQHAKNLEGIQNGTYKVLKGTADGVREYNGTIADAQKEYSSQLKIIWGNLLADMDEAQQQQLGTLFAMAANTVSAGGKLDEETQNLVQSIGDCYNSLPNEIKDSLDTMLDDLNLKISEQGEVVYKSGDKVGQKIFDGMQDGAEKSCETSIKKIAESMSSTFANTLYQTEPELQQTVANTLGSIKNGIQATQPQLEEMFHALGVQLPDGLCAGIANQAPNVQAGTIDLLTQIAAGTDLKRDELKTLLNNFGIENADELCKALEGKEQQTQLKAVELLCTLKNATDSERPAILSKLQDLGVHIGDTLTDNAASSIQNGTPEVKQQAKQVGESVTDGLNQSNAKQESSIWGSDLVQGLAQGIKGAVGWVANAALGIADTISRCLHFSRPDVGPLREYEKWMPDMMQGLAKGIRDNVGQVVRQAMALASELKDTIPQTIPIGIDVSGIDTSATVGAMQRAVALSQARVYANVSADTNAKIFSKWNMSALFAQISQACKSGCESAELSADVKATVDLNPRNTSAALSPYMSKDLAKGGAYD